MPDSLLRFFKGVFSDYARRFWRFWIILYIATALAELFRQAILEMLAARFGLDFRAVFGSTIVLKEFLTNPLLIVMAAGALFFTMWGFAALYFSFTERTVAESMNAGAKNTPRYFAFVAVAGFITLLGFGILPLAALWLLDALTGVPVFLADGETLNYALALPLFFILGAPGIYLLISFANAPFILLLENRGILRSLQESRQRMHPVWWRAAIALASALFICGIAYYFLSWIIFTLKLAFVPDLSFRSETILRVFLYSFPWVVSASFFDLALYHFYADLRRMSASNIQ